MVFLWRIPERFPEGMIAKYKRTVSPDRLAFLGASPIDVTSLHVELEFGGTSTELATLDALPNDAQVPVVGPRLARLLEAKARDDVQLIPATVHTRDGARDTGFNLVNIKHSVHAIDRSRSVVSTIAGTSQVRGFRKLVHKEDCLGPRMIARDADYLVHILVNQALMHEIRRIGATGVDLKTAESIVW